MAEHEYFGSGTGQRLLEKLKSALGGKANQSEVDSLSAEIADQQTAIDGKQPKGDYALKNEIPSVPVASVNGKTGAIQLGAADVDADPAGTASGAVYGHNTSDAAHNDIRLLITGLTTRLNALANSTDEDLDQMAEIVAYIKSNKSLIDSITTSKVSVSDIIDNLTTSVSNKPLSAKMGVQLKSLIDAIKIPTSLPASDVYAWAKAESKPTYTASEVGARPSTWLPSASEVGAPTTTQFNTLSNTVSEQKTAIDSKLPKNFGASNAGKILVVGSDGNLTLTDMPEGGASGDVVGTLDESNNILLSGNIAEGTYPLKWVMDDGTLRDAGTLTVVLTPEPEPIINWITNSINADGTPFVGTNGEKGYKTNTRLSTSSGAESTSSASGIETTGFIPVKLGDTMYIKNITILKSATNQSMVFYNSSFEITKTGGANQSANYMGNIFGDVNGELKSVVLTTANVGNNNFNEDVAYIRICAGEINENSIITINQPIE